ncbi:MAG: glycosyltransferase family 2 protein [Thermoanaerobaculia bacterium]|nr:glycosyltransferase family 2 protein [Thermoanaerobaculia bacterium]
MSKPRVAALILNYNGREVTLQALGSLAQSDYPALDLVVIDNGSTDGSSAAVKEAFPQVTVLRIEENHGPANGCNTGMRWALERGYDYQLILNNDIEVAADFVSQMVAVAESDPSIGCVGPKGYYYWDRERIWSAGGILRFKESVTKERGEGEIDRGQYDRDEEVDYVNGCAMLVRRQAIEAAGFWDPIYFLSVEDGDFCMRVKRKGYRCFYAHRAKLWHMVSQSTGGYKPGKTFQTGRSSAIFVRRYANPWQWCTALLFIAAALPAAFLRELPRGNTAAVIAKARGFWAGFRVPMTPPPLVTGLPNLERADA